jgi:hypothetical protein
MNAVIWAPRNLRTVVVATLWRVRAAVVVVWDGLIYAAIYVLAVVTAATLDPGANAVARIRVGWAFVVVTTMAAGDPT